MHISTWGCISVYVKTARSNNEKKLLIFTYDCQQ